MRSAGNTERVRSAIIPSVPSRTESGEPPVRLHRWPVSAGIAAGVVLAGGTLVLFETTGGDGAPPGVPPQAIATAPPSPSPAPPREEKRPTPPPEEAPPGKKPKAGGPGRLTVDDGGCREVRAAGLPTRCRVRLTAAGGDVTWSVASVRSKGARIRAAGCGTLAAGRSASLAVTVRPRLLCFLEGSGGGTIAFAPGGSATVTYACRRS